MSKGSDNLTRKLGNLVVIAMAFLDIKLIKKFALSLCATLTLLIIIVLMSLETIKLILTHVALNFLQKCFNK